MSLNQETGKITPAIPADEAMAKKLAGLEGAYNDLVSVDGLPIPKHHIIFKLGELVTIKDATFKVVYIGSDCLTVETVKPEDALTGGA